MGTGARMIVKNHTGSELLTTLSNVICMCKDGDRNSHLERFSNMYLSPYRSSDSVYIEADSACVVTQSSFSIGMLNGQMTFDLGKGAFKTAIAGNTNPAQIQAVLAPTTPLIEGPDYDFYLVGGPGIVAPLINSVIQANLPAIISAIASTPLVFEPKEGNQWKVVLVGFYFTISFPYVSTLPGTDKLTFSAILNASGTASGFAQYKGVPSDFAVDVNKFSALIEGNVDFSTEKPVGTITTFACSIDSCKLNPGILRFLAIIFPAFTFLVTHLEDLAGMLNGAENQWVLGKLTEGLNAAIEAAIGPKKGETEVPRPRSRTGVSA